MICRNKTKNIEIACNIVKADNIKSRLVGLISRNSIGDEDGLFIAPCCQIHTCFMKFPIDAVFVDKGFKVLKIIMHMKTWRFSTWVYGAYGVLELKSGRTENSIAVGDILELDG